MRAFIFLSCSVLLILSYVSNSLIIKPKVYRHRCNTQLSESSLSNTLSLGFGTLGLMVILINRLSIPLESVSNLQSRSDIISVIALSALLLSSISDQDIQTKERPSVSLVGYSIKNVEILSDNKNIGSTASIEFVLQSLSNIATVTSVHLYSKGKFLGRCGVVGNKNEEIVNMPILDDVLRSKKQVYLPDLQIIPGKIEFTYLPINCQSVLIVPLISSDGGAIIVGTNKAKSFQSGDIEKIITIVETFESIGS